MKNVTGRILPLAVLTLFAVGCSSTPPAQETKPETKAAAETKPAQGAAPAQAAAPARARDMGSYNVVRGDHLWGISSKPTIYGNPYQWPLIFKANRSQIADADLIEPGQVLAIDKKPTSADINAAVNHARTRGAWRIGVTEESDLDYLAHAPK